MKVLVNCGKLRNGREALIIKDGKTIKYLTCRNYDPTEPEGRQWEHGEYCHNIVSFAKLILAENETIDYDRMDEITCQAMSYLKDNDLLEDFLYDRDIDLDEDEMEYFFPEEGDE